MFGTPEGDRVTAGRDRTTSLVAMDPLESIDSAPPGTDARLSSAAMSHDDGIASKATAMTTHCNSHSLESTRTELVEDYFYECPYCGDKRIELELNGDSKGLITQEKVAYLPLAEFTESPKLVMVKRVVCMSCGEDVPAALLPDRLLLGHRHAPAMELQINTTPPERVDTSVSDSSDAQAASTLEDVVVDESEAFGCPRCSCRDAVVRLEVYVQYSDDYKPLTGRSAQVSESRLRRATCHQCGYAFLEGMLPSQIVVRSNFKWTIDVCLGVFVPYLRLTHWKDLIAGAVRSAYILVIRHQQEAARRLVRRIIRILHIRSRSLTKEPDTTVRTASKRWKANEMLEVAELLEEKFLARPLPVFDPRQCIESSGCPRLWLDAGHSNSEPPCFQWSGGSCRKKKEAEQDQTFLSRSNG